MAVDLHAVDPDGGIPVHRAEVQQDAIALAPVFGDVEGAAVPEPVVRADRLHHAGQSRLDRERHENLPVEITWLPVVLRPDRIVPQTVEVEPVLTDHLGPGILGVGTLRPDIMGPLRHQRAVGRLPRGAGDQTQARDQNGGEPDRAFV